LDRAGQLRSWLQSVLGGADFDIAPASVDASFRRYFRVRGEGARPSLIAMDAPPEKENCRQFVHVAYLFREAGVHVPEIRAQNLEQGFLLLSDLGSATYLDVLEESLASFEGGLVLVTHDRFMLDRIATVIVALDGEGGAETFADYAQWEAARARARPIRSLATKPLTVTSPQRGEGGEKRKGKRLGYLEQREWDGMEEAILEAEAALERCRQAAEDPRIASDPVALQERHAALDAARAAVDRLYARWAELEAKGDTR